MCEIHGEPSLETTDLVSEPREEDFSAFKVNLLPEMQLAPVREFAPERAALTSGRPSAQTRRERILSLWTLCATVSREKVEDDGGVVNERGMRKRG